MSVTLRTFNKLAHGFVLAFSAFDADYLRFNYSFQQDCILFCALKLLERQFVSIYTSYVQPKWLTEP